MLPFTKQLLPLIGRNLETGKYVESQWTVVDKQESDGRSFTAAYPSFASGMPTFNQSLSSAIEELFHNITLSFLSEAAFVRDSEEEVNITIQHTQNVYSYDSTNLLLCYGIALGLSLLACIFGGASIFMSQASYSNKFSTTMRATRGSRIEDLIQHKDRSGEDPLPEYLTGARIVLGQRLETSRGEDDLQLELTRVSEQRSKMVSEGSLVSHDFEQLDTTSGEGRRSNRNPSRASLDSQSSD